MIQFNHNGAPSPPGWDDMAHSLLLDAARLIDRGDAVRALLLIEEARNIVEQYIEEYEEPPSGFKDSRGVEY